MIRLLEPQRPPGFVSGGYRYQAEVGRRLSARGDGELQVVAPVDLMAAVAEAAADIVVVDGLFVTRTRQPLPAGVLALLHTVPEVAPWAAASLGVIATGAATGAAVAAAARAVEIVRPGVDGFFRPRPDLPQGPRRRVACVGTVWPGKGQLLLARALATSALASRCDLVLVGDHGIDRAYADAVVSAGAPCTVELLGVRSPAEVAHELQGADLCVSASRDESYGMAVAEAVACGVPVFAFATGEIPTFVQDGRNGWLLPATASDDTFARRLHEVLADDGALPRARTAAVAPRRRSWDEVASDFTAACLRLTGD